MKEKLSKVYEFMDKFNQAKEKSPTGEISLDLAILRYKLMREENEEYLDAALAGDTAKVADGLGDKLYILCGTIIAHGMQGVIDDVFNEIHGSNMSKLGEDGKPVYREDGKVLKGPGYWKPDLTKFFPDDSN